MLELRAFDADIDLLCFGVENLSVGERYVRAGYAGGAGWAVTRFILFNVTR